MAAPSANNNGGENIYANNEDDRQQEKETLLPVLDKTATIRTLMSRIDKEDEEISGKEWELEDEDDEVYVMSEDDFHFDEESVLQADVAGGENDEMANFTHFQVPEEESSEASEYSEGDAEIVIEDPFEPATDEHGDKSKIEEISLDNIIPSGRRRNQQII